MLCTHAITLFIPIHMFQLLQFWTFGDPGMEDVISRHWRCLHHSWTFCPGLSCFPAACSLLVPGTWIMLPNTWWRSVRFGWGSCSDERTTTRIPTHRFGARWVCPTNVLRIEILLRRKVCGQSFGEWFAIVPWRSLVFGLLIPKWTMKNVYTCGYL